MVQDGSRQFKKVQEGSRKKYKIWEWSNFQEGSRRFKKVQEGSWMFMNFKREMIPKALIINGF